MARMRGTQPSRVSAASGAVPSATLRYTPSSASGPPNRKRQRASPRERGRHNRTGKVIETMDAGGYTYVHLDDGAEKVWAAGPVTPIEVGQEIHISASPLKVIDTKIEPMELPDDRLPVLDVEED